MKENVKTKTIAVSDLQKGDICLYHGNRSFISKVIRKIDGTKYSHASIYLWNNMMEEAIGRGVIKRDIYASIQNGASISIRRLTNRPDNMGAVLNIADLYLGNRYAYSQLLFVVAICLT